MLELKPTFGIDVSRVSPVGSRFACTPPVTDTDIDILVLTTNNLTDAAEVLRGRGWEVHTSEDAEYVNAAAEIPFITARRNLYNLIVYNDPIGFGLFLGAMRVCKLRNWRNKDDRVLAVRAATEDDFFDNNQVAF